MGSEDNSLVAEGVEVSGEVVDAAEEAEVVEPSPGRKEVRTTPKVAVPIEVVEPEVVDVADGRTGIGQAVMQKEGLCVMDVDKWGTSRGSVIVLHHKDSKGLVLRTRKTRNVY